MNHLNRTLFYLAMVVLGLMVISTFTNAKAEVLSEKNIKAPTPFEDSNIKRKLKDGTIQEFDGNKYKIVRRKTGPQPQHKPTPAPAPAPKIIVKTKPSPKNRLTLYGGYGPNDLEINETATKVRLDKDGLFGIGYSRKIGETLSLDAVILSNETFMGGLGVNF